MTWQFARRTDSMKRSTIREILKLTAQPHVISFAGGLPASEYFPTDRLQAATDIVLAERGREALQYSPTEGMPELREMLAQRLSSAHLQVKPEQILIVSGSQQALDFIGRAMLDEGDSVVVENPTYLGMLLAWRPFGVNFRGVEMESDGLKTDELPALFAEKPKIMYSAPTFQNPSGATLSAEKRRQLAQYVADAGVPLVEDNAYSELRYSGDASPSLLEMNAIVRQDTDLENGQVIYVGTFSKILTPGLRVGWVAAPSPLLEKLIQIKQAADLHTSTLNQYIIYEVAKEGFLDTHIERLRDVYRQRRDVMLAALDCYFPPECTWTHPDGGLFLMVYLPKQLNAAKLLEEAIQQDVAFIHGDDFFIGGVGSNTMRLNFSASSPARIEEGIRRLGEVVKKALTR